MEWKSCEKDINTLRSKFNLDGAEIHTGWINRPYIEQNNITGFNGLSQTIRRSEVTKYRRRRILALQSAGNSKRLSQAKKNFAKTEPYIHLTLDERKAFLKEVAETIGNWGFARIYAECIDKIYFDPSIAQQSISEQAFEQLISRFEQYLSNKNRSRDAGSRKYYGLLIHDNNQSVERKHTELTSMIQISDLCSYALRRYLENSEVELFNEIFKRADRRGERAVGIRHFTDSSCRCEICQNHS